MPVHTQAPLGDVEVVGAPVGHHAAGVVADLPPAAAVVAAASFGVVRLPGSRAQPAVPIEALADGFLGQVFLLGRGTDVDMDRQHLSDPPAADQFAGEAEVALAALLAAGLKHAAVSSHRRDHVPGLADRQRQRLLAVDVLAGPGRRARDDRVPVVGRGNQDGVDVLSLQQTLELVVLVAALERAGLPIGGVLLLDLLLRIAALDGVDVADGDHLDLLVIEEAAKMAAAHVSDPDESDRDSLARGLPAAPPQRGRRDEIGGGYGGRHPLEERSTGHTVSVTHGPSFRLAVAPARTPASRRRDRGLSVPMRVE